MDVIRDQGFLLCSWKIIFSVHVKLHDASLVFVLYHSFIGLSPHIYFLKSQQWHVILTAFPPQFLDTHVPPPNTCSFAMTETRCLSFFFFFVLQLPPHSLQPTIKSAERLRSVCLVLVYALPSPSSRHFPHILCGVWGGAVLSRLVLMLSAWVCVCWRKVGMWWACTQP